MDTTIIETQNLTRTFGNKIALNGINLHVTQGEIFGYLGPNGSGKTTTIRILLGLIRPTSGQARVLGQDVTKDMSLIREKIGVVLEYPGLYDRLSAWENLGYYGRIFHLPKHKLQERIETLLSKVGLWEERSMIVGTFSKGMKQRLALARSLLHDAKLLFLDEPTSGLDPETTILVRQLILDLAHKEGRTIFINSHDLNEVERICSDIAILNKGRIQVMDKVENLHRQFNSAMVEITVRDRPQAERANSILSTLPFVADSHCEQSLITVYLQETSVIPQVIEALVKGDIPVEEMRKVNRTLEDAYMAIVHATESEHE